MLGHLNAEEFVNLMEGGELPARRRAHLDGCVRCHATWQSVQSVHAGMTSLDADVPEPDWIEFRSSVRDRLLSRSVQRESAVRRWTGWPVRPAMAWGLSLLLAVGITIGAFLWRTEERPAPLSTDPTVSNMDVAPPGFPSIQLKDIERDAAIWSRTALFDDLLELSDSEQEQLRQMLESAQKGTLNQQ
jgi:hypothetical protein